MAASKPKPLYQTKQYAAFKVSDASDPHTGFLAIVVKRLRAGYSETIEATCMVEGVVKDRVDNMTKRRMHVRKLKAA